MCGAGGHFDAKNAERRRGSPEPLSQLTFSFKD
jgi:hypothetical protein